MTKLLTATEVADRLSVSIKTIRKWTCQRSIPFIKLGASVRFREDDLEDWIKRNRQKRLTPSGE